MVLIKNKDGWPGKICRLLFLAALILCGCSFQAASGKKPDAIIILTDEGGVRSPLFVSWKGKIPSGHSIAQVPGAIDILPARAELCGIDWSPGKNMDGVSLAVHILKDTSEPTERYLLNYWNGNISVRSQQFRLDRVNALFHMLIFE
jgi:hypothetical protein